MCAASTVVAVLDADVIPFIIRAFRVAVLAGVSSVDVLSSPPPPPPRRLSVHRDYPHRIAILWSTWLYRELGPITATRRCFDS